MPEPPSEIQNLTSSVQQMMQHMMSMQEESRKSNDNLVKLLAASLEKGNNVRDCNAVTILRSGKQYQNPEPLAQEPTQEEESQDGEDLTHEEAVPNGEEEEDDVPILEDIPPRKNPIIAAPFPQRLAQPSKGKNNIEIGEIFRKVNINIPLLDAISQIPAYAKYLKDLCTIKRQLNVRKKAFSTEHVNALAHPSTPLKLKDPGMPTIACVIGSKLVKDALLDLGTSVNLMPYSIYVQLGLGEMQPTSKV